MLLIAQMSFPGISCLQALEIRNIKCAIIQYEVQAPDSVAHDADRLEKLIEEAAANGAWLVVCPETTFYRYAPWDRNNVTMLQLAKAYDDLKARFTALARRLRICLVYGVREPSGDPARPVYNTALFIGPDGKIIYKHHKIRVSNAELSYTKAGSTTKGDAHVFQSPFGRVGLLICKDMDTTGLPDYLVQQEMDLFIGISGDPTRGWEKVSYGCQQGHAYGIGANQIGANSGQVYGGRSGFVDPYGRLILGAGSGDVANTESILYTVLPLPFDPSYSFPSLIIAPQYLLLR